MIILGLDPGTASTGYGAIKITNKIELVGYGVVSTKANSYMPQRLCEIYKEVRRLIDKFQPDKISIESLFFFKNQKTVMSVSQARGVIMMACQSKKVPIFEYPPLRVKSILCQNGRADKKEVQEKVRKILKLTLAPKPDDAADALASAICCNTCHLTDKSDKIKVK